MGKGKAKGGGLRAKEGRRKSEGRGKQEGRETEERRTRRGGNPGERALTRVTPR